MSNSDNKQPRIYISSGPEPGTFSIKPVDENTPSPITPKQLSDEEAQAFEAFKARSNAAEAIDFRIVISEDPLPQGILAKMYRGSDPAILIDQRALNDVDILMTARWGLTGEMARNPEASGGNELSLTEDFVILRADGSEHKMEVMRNAARPSESQAKRDDAFRRQVRSNADRAHATTFEGRRVKLLRFSELMQQS